MKIELQRIDDGYHIEARNESGNIMHTGASEKIGGSNKGMRPMQLLLVGIGSCSAIDIISILKKQKQPLEDFAATVTAEREEGELPNLFTKIHVAYRLKGALTPKKVELAVKLSIDKYCSVARILEKTAEITWEYEILE